VSAATEPSILALVRAGRRPKDLTKALEPSELTIRNGAFQEYADSGERPEALTADERTELQRLRREHRQLKVERDLLGTVAAFSHGSRGRSHPSR
jgi:transposase